MSAWDESEPGHDRFVGLAREERGYPQERWRGPAGREVVLYRTGAYAGDGVLVVDGVEVDRASWFSRCTFSPDGRRLVFVRHPQPLASQLVEDGRVLWDADGQIRTLEFSPDGLRLAWLVEIEHGYTHVAFVDGVEVDRHTSHPRAEDGWWWVPPWHPLATR